MVLDDSRTPLLGGEVVAVGSPGDLIATEGSPTGKWLAKAEREVEKSKGIS